MCVHTSSLLLERAVNPENEGLLAAVRATEPGSLELGRQQLHHRACGQGCEGARVTAGKYERVSHLRCAGVDGRCVALVEVSLDSRGSTVGT